MDPISSEPTQRPRFSLFNLIIGFQLIVIFLTVAGLGLIGWVAYHFISKYW